jgi:hypothetical protein
LGETFGLCGKRTLPPPGLWIPGQSLPGMTRYLVWGGLFLLSEHHFTNGLSQSISCRSCRSCHPRSISFPLIVAPIYMGVGIICITLPGVGLPTVILNPVRDDLRMMAPKPVAAKEGAMKEKQDIKHFMFPGASIMGGYLRQNQGGNKLIFKQLHWGCKTNTNLCYMKTSLNFDKRARSLL